MSDLASLVQSDSDTTSTDEDLVWDGNLSQIYLTNMTDPTTSSPEASGQESSSTETLVNKTDLASVISYNTRNNYNRVQGLKYFNGGKEKDPSKPELVFEVNPKNWIRDIEARTADNFNDEGKIQVAKQYSIGTAFTAICSIVEVEGNDWEKVKTAFFKIFPDTLSFNERKAAVVRATRQPGETLTDFFVRLQAPILQLIKEEPEYKKSLENDLTSTFMLALPMHFRTYLTKEDLKVPTTVLEKALQFVHCNPQLKLRNEDIAKETRQTVAMVTQAPDKRAYDKQQGARPKNNRAAGNTITCYRCQKQGHIARDCRVSVCAKCNLVGHLAKDCRRNRTSGTGWRTPKQNKKNPGGW